MTVSLKVLKVSQPIGEFYIGSIESRQLLEIARSDVRRFSGGTNGKPTTIDGIQRELSKSRVKELREYVSLNYATFPTSVILAIDHRCVTLDPVSNCHGLFDLKIKPYVGSAEEGDSPIELEATAFVIDGQHRLAGLEAREPGLDNFDVNVSIFVGTDLADQAEIFSRVNLAQTTVNKSLAYDLFDYAKDKSPAKVAHDLVLALNDDKDGPFYRKIKRLGVRTPGIDGETLAQATVVNGLLRHLPKNQEKERSKSLLGWSRRAEPNESRKDRIFVDFYRADELVSIFLTITHFFEAARDKWPNAWTKPEEGQILMRTTGFNALIRFLKDAYLSAAPDNSKVVSKEEFAKIFGRIEILETQLNRDEYVPGSSGQGMLYRHLKEQSGL